VLRQRIEPPGYWNPAIVVLTTAVKDRAAQWQSQQPSGGAI